MSSSCFSGLQAAPADSFDTAGLPGRTIGLDAEPASGKEKRRGK
jgi:hypothetical protein